MDALLQELSTLRRQGYGEDNEEFVIGCKCVARPVRDARGRTVAAMSVTVPTPRLTPDLMAASHRGLVRAVQGLERLMP